MKNLKNLSLGLFTIIIILSTSITAFAVSSYQNPTEAIASITNQTLEEVIKQRQKGVSYGEMAYQAGKLEEFKEAMLELQKSRLEEKIANGYITQSQAELIIQTMEENQSNCTVASSSNANSCGLRLSLGQGTCLGNTKWQGVQNGTGYKGNGQQLRNTKNCLMY